MANLKNTPAWQNLEKHFNEIEPLKLRDLFSENKNRFNELSLQAPQVFLDYSKNRITSKTIELLTKLAKTANLDEKIQEMFSGHPINKTENRAVLHTALRNRSSDPIIVDGIDIMPQIRETLAKMRDFSKLVRDGEWLGFTDKPMTDIVNIGIGGSDLGPKMVTKALSAYANDNLRCHFVSNIDGTQIVETLKRLNPETTLFCVASKTFTTIETLTNAETAKAWLLGKLGDPKAVAKHFIAISTNKERVKAFGIDTKNMFEFWDWVGGRYSVWSSIGMSIALYIGMDNFEKFLAGAYEMDQHFRYAKLHENMPALLALLGIWYRNFFNATSQAILPYDQYLQYFTAYLQQLDMESNGMTVCLDNDCVYCQTGPVIWGGIGTDGQHAFHQLLHQGTDLIPIDFIVPIKSLNPIGKHHDLLFANCLAQSQALLQGKTFDEAYAELTEKGISEETAKTLALHKVMSGNRPSNTLVLEKLTPETLGALIALYEHKVFVQGVIWNVNSFDQWGVELGKQLANKIVPNLEREGDTKDYDSSTLGLINLFRDRM